MTKGKEIKTIDPRLIALVGSFLKVSGLTSTAKIYKVEIEKRKLKTSESVVGPESLAEALEVWDKAAAGGIEDAQDGGNESDTEGSDSENCDSESSDSGEDTPDSIDAEGDEDGVKSDSSATVTGNDTEGVKPKVEKAGGSDDSSDSSSDSSSSSSSSSSSASPSDSSSDSDSSSSSDSSSDSDKAADNSDSSDSDKAADKSDSSDADSDSSSSSDSDSGSSSDSESSPSDEDDKKKTKKPKDTKKEENKKMEKKGKKGASAPTPVQKEEADTNTKRKRYTEPESQPDVKKVKVEPSINKRFSRINVAETKYEDETLKRNDYEAVGFADNHYAARAHQDLVVTRGKGFTKEKNKKKRGSYRGGAIDFSTKSYKFKE